MVSSSTVIIRNFVEYPSVCQRTDTHTQIHEGYFSIQPCPDNGRNRLARKRISWLCRWGAETRTRSAETHIWSLEHVHEVLKHAHEWIALAQCSVQYTPRGRGQNELRKSRQIIAQSPAGSTACSVEFGERRKNSPFSRRPWIQNRALCYLGSRSILRARSR
jgi:hypothetical protein